MLLLSWLLPNGLHVAHSSIVLNELQKQSGPRRCTQHQTPAVRGLLVKVCWALYFQGCCGEDAYFAYQMMLLLHRVSNKMQFG